LGVVSEDAKPFGLTRGAPAASRHNGRMGKLREEDIVPINDGRTPCVECGERVMFGCPPPDRPICGDCLERRTLLKRQIRELEAKIAELARERVLPEIKWSARMSGTGPAQEPSAKMTDDTPRHMLDFLLTRIGSWTNARWDQHLRDEYGDEKTDLFIAWLGYTKRPAGTPPELSIFPKMLPPQWTFSCSARKANTGANDPAECGWPTCGCDPHADKVIEALEEMGALKEKVTSVEWIELGRKIVELGTRFRDGVDPPEKALAGLFNIAGAVKSKAVRAVVVDHEPESRFAGILAPHECWIQKHSSRVCEDGVKGCVREHAKKEAQP
jgi:hypothetical protein